MRHVFGLAVPRVDAPYVTDIRLNSASMFCHYSFPSVIYTGLQINYILARRALIDDIYFVNVLFEKSKRNTTSTGY